MYNSLYYGFYSPFINLTIEPADYIRLLRRFKDYMKQPLVMKKDRDIYGEPVGALGDVEIRFTHYTTFAEAEKCWVRRLKRMNYDNLFIYMAITDAETAVKFSELDFQRKAGFCDQELHLDSVYYLKSFRESREAVRNFGSGRSFISYMNDLARRKLYDYDDSIGNRGAKVFKAFDALKLLSGEKDFMRYR